MNNIMRLIKWAKDHGKNPKNILRLFKKATVTEKMLMIEEIKDERESHKTA